LHPDVVQYTYWDFFRNSFKQNFGWRIDHILATPVLAEKCRRAEVDMSARSRTASSDHTIVWAEFD
jgi:exodeoxyribonuclease-3